MDNEEMANLKPTREANSVLSQDSLGKLSLEVLLELRIAVGIAIWTHAKQSTISEERKKAFRTTLEIAVEDDLTGTGYRYFEDCGHVRSGEIPRWQWTRECPDCAKRTEEREELENLVEETLSRRVQKI